jgi:hypothetical protein
MQNHDLLKSLYEARWIIRDSQKLLHSADDWHFLADSINYLDAQIANLEDSIYPEGL